MAAMLPSGGIPTRAISSGIDAVHPGGWPSDPLWLCASRLRDGKRVVFGRPGGPAGRVGQAVAASCAVPGYFQPVAIDGSRYIDGGMRSLTNADLLRSKDLDLDLVIVSSPMSQVSGRLVPTPLGVVRQAGKWQLRYELVTLRRAGRPAVAIEPGRRVTHVMGLNPLDARPRVPVSRVTYASVVRWLSDHSEGRWVAAMLASAATASAGSDRPRPGFAASSSGPA